MNVVGLFPVPVSVVQERHPTGSELSYIKSVEKRENQGNETSKDSYILDRDELSELRNVIQFHIDEFFFKILSGDISCKLKITQSWCNYTESDEYHHRHAHSNSAVSGVYYPQAEHPEDNLIFYSPTELGMVMEPNKHDINPYNSTTWWLPVKTGSMLLFPSYLYHSVRPIKNRDTTRISLSFNTFYDGLLGEKARLNNLKVKTCT